MDNSRLIVGVKVVRSNSIIGDCSIVATTVSQQEVMLVNFFGDEPKPNWVAEDYIGKTVERAFEMVNEKLCRFFDPDWQPLPKQPVVRKPSPSVPNSTPTYQPSNLEEDFYF